MNSIADELENRKVEICLICKENPIRENLTTCSVECSKKRYSLRNNEYNIEYRKRPEVITRIPEPFVRR